MPRQNSGWEEHIKVLCKENEMELSVLMCYRSCCENLEENYSGRSPSLLKKVQENTVFKGTSDRWALNINRIFQAWCWCKETNECSFLEPLSTGKLSPLRTGGGSCPSRHLPTRQTLPGKGCSSQGPSPWPPSFLCFGNCRWRGCTWGWWWCRGGRKACLCQDRVCCGGSCKRTWLRCRKRWPRSDGRHK